jgi:RHS repeat-associated protein
LTYQDGVTAGSYTHDLAGRLTQQEIVFGTGPGAFSKVVKRTYEPNGQLKTLEYPNGDVSHFDYDSRNRLATYRLPGLAAPDNSLTYQYNQSTVVAISGPAGMHRDVTLDDWHRPKRVRVLNSAGTAIFDEAHEFDQLSNVSRTTTPDGQFSYTYDSLNRLMSSTPPAALQLSAGNPDGLPVESYEYDAAGNRTRGQQYQGSWTYNANDELLSAGEGSGSLQFEYNENGGLRRETRESPARDRQYAYDQRGRLIEVSEAGALLARYDYDPRGYRVRLESASGTKWFLYGPEGLLGEYDASGAAVREYGWKPSGTWGSDLVWQRDNQGFHVAHSDHMQVTRLLTNATSGEVTWAGQAESFGRTRVAPESSTSFVLRLPGQIEDDVGHYNLHRYYRGDLGRYLSRDPLGVADGPNGYVYAGSNPISLIDPYGLERTNWIGEMYGVTGSVGALLHASGETGFFDVQSECKCGKRVRAAGNYWIESGGLGIGVGLSTKIPLGTDDWYSFGCPHASDPNGTIANIQSGASVVIGYMWSTWTMGRLYKDWTVDWEIGLAVDITTLETGIGLATVMESLTVDCCEEGK